MAIGGGFVGRHDERAGLAEALHAAQSGQPRLVIVGGEAGVGKTRLLDHAAGTAQAAGMRVLRSAAIELGAEGLPLAPVTTVLRSLLNDPGRERLTALLPEVDTLLRLLPEVGRTGGEPGGQARVFDVFGALLRRLSAEAPVLLCIDDLQWADRSTRELLGLLARTLAPARVLLVVAYRSDDLGRGHPLRPFLAGLARLPGVRRMDVDRLSRAETAELMAGLLGHPPEGRMVDEIYGRSSGNPFFAEELTRAAAGSTLRSTLRSTVPSSLREMLLDRTDRLPGPAGQVVRAAAVGGQQVSHDLLAAAAGLDEGELLAALRAAAAAGVLAPDPPGYAFRHRLLRDAVLDDLLPAERVRLHRTYAEALEANPGLVPPDRHAAAAAFHWYGAEAEAKALPALLRAAQEAERVHAYAEQVQLLDRALRLPVPDADRPALFDQAITAAAWSGPDLDGLDLIDRALAEVDRAAEPQRTALLLAGRGLILQYLDRDGALTAVEEALAARPADARSLAWARVLDLAAAVLAMRRLAVQARELAAEAAEIATAHGDTGLAANALTTLGWMHHHAGSYDDGLVALRAAEQLARAADDPVQLVRIYLNLADRWHRLGDFRAMIEVARPGLVAAERAGVQRTLGVLLLGQLAAAHFALGEWEEADRVGQQATELAPTGALGARVHAGRAELALARGDRGRARDELAFARALLNEPASEPPALVRLEAELALWENRTDDAVRLIAPPAGSVELAGADPYEVWPLLATAARITAHAQLRAGRPTTPDAGADLVREVASRLPTDTAHFAAYAAQVEAELAAGYAAWEPVAAAWDALGSPYPAAGARLRAAAASLRDRDLDAARRQLRAADTAARRLAAGPLSEEVSRLARGARIPLDDAAPGPDPQRGAAADLVRLGLTEREVEVLRLVASGRSNRQIGEELFISPKTVSVHVSNLLGKVGAANRGEAAALAHRLRLFDQTSPPR